MRAEIISAADGTALSARTYEPDSPDHGSVVIGGAMGVRQDYYAPFAQWLAGRGWRVTTFDYRGSGDSGPSGSALRGFKADLFDWGRDYEAAIDHFGPFRSEQEASLWPRMASWLGALAAPRAA